MNQLQPPGAGLPTIERHLLNGLFKTACMALSDKLILNSFSRESELLYQIAEHDNVYDVFYPLQIPRVIGIEDSSRKWSVMMVLEHLCLTNLDIMKAIEALTSGVVPRGEIAIEMYKPREDLDFTVLDRYREVNSRYISTVRTILDQKGRLSTKLRYPHPWFGLLNAHQWHCLAWIHQRVHRRQAKKIVAMLGVI